MGPTETVVLSGMPRLLAQGPPFELAVSSGTATQLKWNLQGIRFSSHLGSTVEKAADDDGVQAPNTHEGSKVDGALSKAKPGPGLATEQ